MTRLLSAILLALAGLRALAADTSYQDFEAPPHRYFERTPTDRFTKLKAAFESGQLPVDRTGEKPFLISLLRLLGVPASSQLLLFSTTSLQLSFINPSNPRALYFSEDMYVGFIPGGRIEILSIDPELGGIFYIFDVPRGPGTVRVERSTRCMNCHAGEDTGYVPGISIRSVLPGPTGGSLDSFRREQMGHQVPFAERFGGYHVTGEGAITNHWGNLLGRQTSSGIQKTPVRPGERFSFAKYPVATSDMLAHLLHEHQGGFVNRAVEAGYRARTHLFKDGGKLTPAHQAELDEQARGLTRYLLFADEVALPAGGIPGDPAFKADFLRTRRPVGGASLKDLDLRTRLLKHRCSYMIYSTAFAGLPPVVKQRVYQRLGEALNVEQPDKEYAYLPAGEKQAIRAILRGTLRDLPKGW